MLLALSKSEHFIACNTVELSLIETFLSLLIHDLNLLVIICAAVLMRTFYLPMLSYNFYAFATEIMTTIFSTLEIIGYLLAAAANEL